jgi:hypothetical protein
VGKVDKAKRPHNYGRLRYQ